MVRVYDWVKNLINVCLLPLLLTVMMVSMSVEDLSAKKRSSGRETTSKGVKTAVKKTSGSGSPKKSTSKAVKKNRGTQKTTSGGSKSELEIRQRNAQQEVARTKEELRLNEKEIKQSLASLAEIESALTISLKESKALNTEIAKLQSKIAELQEAISKHEGNLAHLRNEYLKAVKKMRLARKQNSTLAFLMGSENFAQAERRMRYMKEFSAWKDAKTTEINREVALLKTENEKLESANRDQQVLLNRELKVQQKLDTQKREQDAIVGKLKANRSSLQEHLSKKQSEVNILRNQVAALIAEEQRKEEQRLREEERRREEQRLKEERQRKEEQLRMEAERSGEVKEETPKEDKKASQSQDKAQDKKPDKKSEKRKEKKPDTKTDKKSVGKTGKSEKDYASARNREKRSGKASKPADSATKTTDIAKPTSGNTTSAGEFGRMKGKLRKPVDSGFVITSQFGTHSLPDLPDVKYDNPGIDAKTGAGATAVAVYGGKVSGVYMVPGFNTVVIVNHGDYYTVYGNLASTSVKVGDKVNQSAPLGKVAIDPDEPGQSEIHFEVWKGREKLNPSHWLQP